MSKYYFKIKNHKLFAGEGTEGYIDIDLGVRKYNIKEMLEKVLFSDEEVGNIECIEISEKEYLKKIEEIYKNKNYQCIDTKITTNASIY